MSDLDVAAAAKKALGAIEDLLDLLGWGEEPALSRAMDRLLQLKAGPGLMRSPRGPRMNLHHYLPEDPG